MSARNEIEVGPQGRVVIPAQVRRELGIEPGTKLCVLLHEGGILLLPREAVERRLHEMFAGVKHSIVDELLAERRAEALADAEAEARDVDGRS